MGQGWDRGQRASDRRQHQPDRRPVYTARHQTTGEHALRHHTSGSRPPPGTRHSTAHSKHHAAHGTQHTAHSRQHSARHATQHTPHTTTSTPAATSRPHSTHHTPHTTSHSIHHTTITQHSSATQRGCDCGVHRCGVGYEGEEFSP
jgi:hypothetical protein